LVLLVNKPLVKNSTDYRWQMLQLRLYEKRIIEAFDFLRQNNIEPILIKGWAAAQTYPEPYQRQFTDIDLMVSPETYSKTVDCLKNYSENYLIDLHKGAQPLDSLPFESLYKNSITLLCQGTEIRVLCAEDHLRVLCVHWLMDGGEYKDRLWDIYHAVENRPFNFDWVKCLNVVSEKRKKWIVYTISLAHKYFGLNLQDTPLANKIDDIPEWIIKTLEKEWASEINSILLVHCLNDKKKLLQQVRRRISPNPVKATVDMEGNLDNKLQIFYQIGDIFFRLKPSVKRISKALYLIFKNK